MKELYPHNRRAAEAVLGTFENKKYAAVVHATGTGKSYIIAEVAKRFGKVLVVAPSDFVLEETRKLFRDDKNSNRTKVDYKTYAGVMYDENPDADYDLIVLDEFHRAGADKWGIGVKNLLERNRSAKVLGTSATHIRYLDNERNMADELFDGNVVSYLPLKQAIDEGILPSPTYVASLYEIGTTKKKCEQGIRRLRKDEKTKADLSKRLKGITESWEQAHGVPAIMRKYFDKNMKRVIVFCPKVDLARKSKAMLRGWFEEAGFRKVHFYNIDYSSTSLQMKMKGFQEDVEDGAIKVAISVNMLNEGVHIPRVDAIIMMRITVSRIIIEQQIGRCLTTDNKNRRPVVLDLVNNMDMINFCGYSFSGAKGDRDNNSKSEGFPFNVIDECCDIRIFIEQMDSIVFGYHTKEECIESARRYTSRSEWERGDKVLYWYSLKHGWHDECCAHMQNLKHHYTKEECIESAKRYNKRLDWKRDYTGEYHYARRHHILEECCAHMETFLYRRTKEDCIAEAKRYDTVTAWKNSPHSAYYTAQKCGWLSECTAHMKRLIRHYSEEECMETAKRYKRRADFQKAEPNMYDHCRRHNLLDKCCAHMQQPPHHYTKEECIESARQYNQRADWKRNHPGAYHYARKQHILEECCAHMKPPAHRYTKEECMANAKLYASTGEWYSSGDRCYHVARQHGWFEECCAHMKPSRCTRTKEECMANARQYGSYTEWNKNENTIVTYARYHGWLEECKTTAFGNYK